MMSKKIVVTLSIILFTVGCATMKLPGQSMADFVLQSDTLASVMSLDRAADNNACKQRNVVNTEIVDYPKIFGKDPWTEKWTVDRCGEKVYYKIVFTPTPQIGGTDFMVSVWE